MELFLFEKSWFFMDTLFRLFGIYPCQRIGESGLKPTSTCRFWTRYVFTATINILIVGTPIAYASWQETNFDIFIQAFLEEFAVTLYDKIAMIAVSVVPLILHTVCIMNIGTYKERMCRLQQYVNENANKTGYICNVSTWKFLKHVATYSSLMISAGLFTYIGWFYSIKGKINLSWIITHVMIFSHLVHSFFAFMPLFYFTMVYFEVTINLVDYCDTITRKSSSLLVEETKVFSFILKEFSSMVSPFIFNIFSTNFVFLLVISFFVYTESLSSLTGIEEMVWYAYFPLIGMALNVGYVITLSYSYCTLSEDLANKVQRLKIAVLRKGNHQTDDIIQELDEFKGFDANGYFTLNHSLLTAMTTNFATFLVILVQFKQSETSVKSPSQGVLNL